VKKKISLLLILTVISLTGCTKARYLPQLLTLKEYSDEQEAVDNYVDEQDNKFEFLVEEVKSKAAYNFKDEDSFLSVYGEPIFSRMEEEEGIKKKVLLYRKSKEFFGADKVYVFFDEDGKLLEIDYRQSEKK